MNESASCFALEVMDNLVSNSPRDSLSRRDAHEPREKPLPKAQRPFLFNHSADDVQHSPVPAGRFSPLLRHQPCFRHVKGPRGERPNRGRREPTHHALMWRQSPPVAFPLVPQDVIGCIFAVEEAHLVRPVPEDGWASPRPQCQRTLLLENSHSAVQRALVPAGRRKRERSAQMRLGQREGECYSFASSRAGKGTKELRSALEGAVSRRRPSLLLHPNLHHLKGGNNRKGFRDACAKPRHQAPLGSEIALLRPHRLLEEGVCSHPQHVLQAKMGRKWCPPLPQRLHPLLSRDPPEAITYPSIPARLVQLQPRLHYVHRLQARRLRNASKAACTCSKRAARGDSSCQHSWLIGHAPAAAFTHGEATPAFLRFRSDSPGSEAAIANQSHKDAFH